jgi:protein-tyrosine phosphatase
VGASASEILPGRLWVRARTNKLPVLAKQYMVDELKLTDVVCVCLIPDPSWAAFAGVHYRHFPWSDSKRRVPKNLGEVADALSNRIERGGRVLIYCDSGRNRSALLAAMVAWKLLAGCTGKQAVALVRAGRPMALKNPLFIQYLESL